MLYDLINFKIDVALHVLILFSGKFLQHIFHIDHAVKVLLCETFRTDDRAIHICQLYQCWHFTWCLICSFDPFIQC